MNINQLFKMCHGELDIRNDLIKITDDEILNFLKSKKLDQSKFFMVNNSIYPYCYFNEQNGTFVEIMEFSESTFEMLSIDERIDYMENEINKLLNENKYSYIFILIDKRLRLYYLNKWYKDISDDEFLEVFKSVYSSLEYGFKVNNNILKKVQELSQNEINELDDIVEIYRGQTPESTYYKEAYSWTLSKNIAEFFATRFKSDGDILKAKVNKKYIITFIDDRNEDELLIFPDKVFNVEII